MELADEEPVGATFKRMGALVLLASTVEGFCQTVGPEVFGSDWDRKKNPIERMGPRKKLELIAKAAHIDVDWGREPWSYIDRLFEVRNALAHPCPASNRAGFAIVCAPDERRNVAMAEGERHVTPLLDPMELRSTLEAVEEALKALWAGLGRKPTLLFMHGPTGVLISGLPE
jgi:hypothetical protein